MNLILPTHNRPVELDRTLCYYLSNPLIFSDIIILDGSDEVHARLNQKLLLKFENTKIKYIFSGQKISWEDRLLSYLYSISDDFVVLGNDEDVFDFDYINEALNYLKQNPSCSLFLGRYITFRKKVLGFPRCDFNRDGFLSMDINSSSPDGRVIDYQRVNQYGCPSTYWALRRRDNLMKSLEIQSLVKLGSTKELIDQMVCCAAGKIVIKSMPMLYNDAVNINYEIRTDHHDRDSYISINEVNLINGKVADILGAEFGLSRSVVVSLSSWYLKGTNYTSLANASDNLIFSVSPQINHCRSYTVSNFYESSIRLIKRISYYLNQIIYYQFLAIEFKNKRKFFTMFYK